MEHRIRENTREKLEQWLIPSVITVVVAVWIGCRYGFWFASNDDVSMNAILSGVFSGTPDFHCVHMSPILSIPFFALYSLLPSIPWFGLFLAGSQLAVLWTCCRCICKRAVRTWVRIVGSLSYALLFCGLLLYWLVFSQYSMTAAILAEGAVFLILLDEQKPDEKIYWKSLVLPLVLFLLAAFIRSHVGLYHLVFLGVACAYKLLMMGGKKAGRAEYGLLTAAVLFLLGGAVFFQDYILEMWAACIILLGCWALIWLVRNFKEQKKRILKYGAFLATAVILTIGSRKLTAFVYATDDWIDYATFSVYRIEIYDHYGVPDNGENAELYESLGLTTQDYYDLLIYDYAFSDNINAYVLQTVAEYAAPVRESVLDDIRETLITVVNRFRDEPVKPDDWLIFLVFAVTVLICILARNPAAVLQLQILYFGYAVCWFYLYWVTRVMDHVYHGITFGVIMVLTGICIEEIRNICQETCRNISYGCVAACGAVCLWINLSQVLPEFEDEYAAQMENNQLWDAYREYCAEHPENLYFTDTGSLAGTGPENMFSPYRTVMNNFVLAGGWTTFNPLYDEKLQYYGIEGSFAKELESGGTLYFICSSDQSEMWIGYYICSEDISVDIQKVDGIYVNSEEVLTVYTITRNDLP